MIRNYNIRNTKLIIWDLDDTFWRGTLSEGEINFSIPNLNFLESLITKGIMNSICSKNDFFLVESTFKQNGFAKFWDYFIFPSINWLPKGERVKEIIQKAGLREENVIFIDDNESNIEEVKFYCPKIMTAFPEQIAKMSEELYLVNDYDFEHTRLKQYKILEQKNKDRVEKNISNSDFLRESEIKICIKNDCENNIERLYKLIGRTNQLNFTKNRVTKEELLKQFKDNNLESGYIVAEDKYGNYGICGLYVLNKNKNKLEHFLFSCRILSMGIEQFVYSYLNFPDIEVKGEVASELKYGETPDWIKIAANLDIKEKEKRFEVFDKNILFKGTCDLLSVIDYIKSEECNLDTELPYWNKNLVYILSHTHTAFIEMTHKKNMSELVKLTQKFPFPSMDEFKTKFFDSKYDIVFLSLFSDSFSGLYKSKTSEDYAVFGFANCDITQESNWDKVLADIPPQSREASIELLKQFHEEFDFMGNPPIEEIIKNLQYIRDNHDSKTHLVLILGSEIPTNKTMKGYEGIQESHKIVNRAVEKFAENRDDVDIINVTKYIKDDDDYTNCINHFSRRIYVEIANEIVAIANKKLGKISLSLTTNN